MTGEHPQAQAVRLAAKGLTARCSAMKDANAAAAEAAGQLLALLADTADAPPGPTPLALAVDAAFGQIDAGYRMLVAALVNGTAP